MLNKVHIQNFKCLRDVTVELEKITEGKIGNKKRQVILTTHSPLLLNCVRPEEVRIFKRDEEGATQVTRMDKLPNVGQMQKEFAPGELWYLLGEEELLAGKTA
jgi:predicted ATPase